MKKDAYYFSHDANARNDIKIIKLRRSLGLEGYAIYFCLIEMLREQCDYKMPLSSIQDIAFDLHTSEEKIKTVIHSFDLFVIDQKHFFSARLYTSMETYNELKNKLVESGRKGGLSRAKASLEQPSSIKGKEIKGNKIKTASPLGKKYKPSFSDQADSTGMVY
jgi:Domain of unknown function (DUF4373)